MPRISYAHGMLSMLIIAFLIYSVSIYCMQITEKNPASNAAQKGKLIWQEKNCIACHQLYGLGGHLGPDLTHTAGEKPEAYIKTFLKTGTKVMPDFKLQEQEIDALIEFLKYTDQTGYAHPRSFIIHSNGTVSAPTKN